MLITDFLSLRTSLLCLTFFLLMTTLFFCNGSRLALEAVFKLLLIVRDV